MMIVRLFWLLTVAFCNSQVLEDATIPFVYTEEEFSENILLKPHFVMFYAPWCGHCQRLRPIWEELAKNINEDDLLDVSIAKVDCTVETKLCSDEGVLGYPTLNFYHPEMQTVRHKGGRDLLSLKAFIQNTLNGKNQDEFSIESIEGLFELTSDNFEDHVATSRHFIMFFAPWCGHCKRLEPTWLELAKLYEPAESKDDDVKIGRVDCTKHREVCKKYEVRGYPTLLWFEDGEKTEKYQGMRELDDLQKFVKKMISAEDEEDMSGGSELKLLEGLHELTENTFNEHTSKGMHFIMFFAPWCGHCKRLEPTWLELARKHIPSDEDSEHVKIGRIDCTKNRKVCSDYGVRGYPSLLWFQDGKNIQSYKGQRDIASLLQFIDNMLNPTTEEDSMEPPKVDKPTPSPPPLEEDEEKQPEGPVLDLNEKNFEFNVAIDFTFVMFYAPWCGFCKRLAPVWEELAAEDFSHLTQEVKIARVDCTKNTDLCQLHKVKGYPTLILFQDNEKVAQYKGDRSLQDLKKFIMEKVAQYPSKDEL